MTVSPRLSSPSWEGVRHGAAVTEVGGPGDARGVAVAVVGGGLARALVARMCACCSIAEEAGNLKKAAFLEEDEEEGQATCRVCWDADSEANLCSPCKCSGTQKHVHLKCLRRWQENVQRRNALDERAYRCSVCRHFFSVKPPQARGGAVALQALRGLGGALCVCLLAFGLSGPPWPHLALLALVLLASRSHWLPGMALLMLCSLLATMHTRGLRVIVRVDATGRLGLSLVRHGAPVEGIGPGVLLVASDGLEHSIFRRSVVLLTQHDRDGTRGVILTQPMPTPPATGTLLSGGGGGEEGEEAQEAAAAAGSGGNRAAAVRNRLARRGSNSQDGGVVLKHFLGGPVGMPGEGVNHEVMVLHTLGQVAGARRIMSPTNDTQMAAAGAGHGAAESGQADADAAAAAAAAGGGDGGNRGKEAGYPLFEGGSISEVLERAAEAAAAAARASSRRGRLRRDREAAAAVAAAAAGDGVPPVLVFHGVCAWAEGQLEGELRAGAWRFSAELAPSVLGLLSLPSDQLWQELADSPTMARVH